MHVILTESHQIPSNPLIGILPSLRGNSSDFHRSTQSNLQPLVGVPDPCDPGSHIAPSACAVQSGEVRTVKYVERRGGCHGGVFYFAALDAYRCSARSSWKGNCEVSQTITTSWIIWPTTISSTLKHVLTSTCLEPFVMWNLIRTEFFCLKLQ